MLSHERERLGKERYLADLEARRPLQAERCLADQSTAAMPAPR